MIPRAAAAASEAIQTTGASISTGIWTLVGVIVVTAGGILTAFIKQWGPWKRVAIDAREADFARLRADIAKQNERIERLESLVEKADQAATAAERHAVRSDAKLQTALTACEVLLSLVEREMPDASEIGLVKRLLAQAASDDMGIGDGMRKLAMMKGPGE